MMNKTQLTTTLRVNGFDETASDETIRAVLERANYSGAEITEAIRVLREEVMGKIPRVDGLHTVFYTDDRLKSSEIAGLLGIEITVDLDPNELRRRREEKSNFVHLMLIIFLSIILISAGSVAYMFFNEIGIFHAVTQSV